MQLPDYIVAFVQPQGYEGWQPLKMIEQPNENGSALFDGFFLALAKNDNHSLHCNKSLYCSPYSNIVVSFPDLDNIPGVRQVAIQGLPSGLMVEVIISDLLPSP